jgi:hypothetical protein
MADLRLTIDASDIPKAQAAVGGLERKITDLARRYAQGSISQQTYNRGLLQLKRNYEQVGVSSQKATSEVRRYAAAQLQAAKTAQQAAVAQRQLATATQGTARGMNRSGVITQQAGYQIGDFIVQVQSGTNAFVAFGQQATQVAGTLTLLGGKWILLGSVLGVAIPLLTAIGAGFLRTRQDADEASRGVETLEDRIRALDNALNDFLRTREALSRGLTPDQLTATEAIDAAERELQEARANAERIRRANEASMITGGGAIPFLGARAAREEAEALAEVESAEQRLLNLRQQMAAEQQANHSRLMQEYQDQITLRETILQSGEDSEEVRLVRAEQALQAEIRRIEALRQAGELTAQQAAELTQAAAQAQALAVQVDEVSNAAGEAQSKFAELPPLIQTIMSALQQTASEAERTAATLDRISSLNTSGTVGAIMAIANALGVATEKAILLAQALPGYASGGVSGPDGAQAQGVGFSTVGGLDPSTIVSSRTFNSGGSGGGRGGGGGGGGFASIFPELAAQVQAAEQALSSFNQEADILNSALENGMISQQQFNQMLQQAQEAYGVADSAAEQYKVL